MCSILKVHSWDCQHKQMLAVFNSDRNALLHMLWDYPNPWQKIKCQCLNNQIFKIPHLFILEALSVLPRTAALEEGCSENNPFPKEKVL